MQLLDAANGVVKDSKVMQEDITNLLLIPDFLCAVGGIGRVRID